MNSLIDALTLGYAVMTNGDKLKINEYKLEIKFVSKYALVTSSPGIFSIKVELTE